MSVLLWGLARVSRGWLSVRDYSVWQPSTRDLVNSGVLRTLCAPGGVFFSVFWGSDLGWGGGPANIVRFAGQGVTVAIELCGPLVGGGLWL